MGKMKEEDTASPAKTLGYVFIYYLGARALLMPCGFRFLLMVVKTRGIILSTCCWSKWKLKQMGQCIVTEPDSKVFFIRHEGKRILIDCFCRTSDLSLKITPDHLFPGQFKQIICVFIQLTKSKKGWQNTSWALGIRSLHMELLFSTLLAA